MFIVYICIDVAQCVPGCVYGTCILTPNICHCYPGWSGTACNRGLYKFVVYEM